MTHASDPAAERRDPTSPLELRVCVYQKGPARYAECPDLDLLAKRPTRREALLALIDEIELYLECAIESGKYDVLVPRPVPASRWRRYYMASRKASWLTLTARRGQVRAIRVLRMLTEEGE